MSSARPVAGSAPWIEKVILQRVAERADEWFPGVGARPTATLRRLGERPRAVLYAVQVGDGRRPRRLVLAKVRRGWTAPLREAGRRPRLVPSLLPASEQTALEFAGLTTMYGLFGHGDPDFGAVRPLEHLAADDTILMEYVDAPTLRDVLLRRSRLSPPIAHPTHLRGEDAWRRAGTWLRVFQQRMPRADLPTRQATRDEVVDRFEAFASFLTRRLGARTGEAARTGANLATGILPERLPLTVGHGDYAPRNVFLLDDGRVAVFDPLSRWLVPRFEDLCRFLVAIRLQGVQVHSHGVAYGARTLDVLERAVIEGYCHDEAVRLPELRCHQLLITLDKWCALVDSPAHGVRGRLRNASVEHAAGYLRGETERLVRLMQSQPG